MARKPKGPRGPPTKREIYQVTQAAIQVFRDHGLDACLFGSTACALYGATRTPNDVDLVVMTDEYDQEQLKELLCYEDGNFFLVPSTNPRATYEVLWYALPARPDQSRDCKVDVLLPGIMDLPWVPEHRIQQLECDVGALPAMPLAPLLLLKLRGWCDHRESRREDFQEKQHVDVEDIEELLDICVEAGVRPQGETWLGAEFLEMSRGRVKEFVDAFPETWGWAELGYKVYDSYA